MPNNIQQSSKFVYFINNSIKYKCLHNYNKLTKCLIKSFSFSSKTLNIIILILNIFGFILYYISLIGCHKGAENLCVTDFFVQFYILAALLIIDCIIINNNNINSLEKNKNISFNLYNYWILLILSI